MTSLEALDTFSAGSRYAFAHLCASKEELAGALLSVDMGMSPVDLATMIRQMTPTQREKLVRLAQSWNTSHAIDLAAFERCTVLALRKLSSFVTAIGEDAFERCASLNVVEWHAPLLTTVGNQAFYLCSTMTLHSWHAPELEVFGDAAFEGCSALVLSKWDAPKLTAIPHYAFMACKELTLNEWNAPLLTTVGYKAFAGCTSLVLPNGLQGDLNDMVIWDSAFLECTSLSAKARSQIGEINPNAFADRV